MTRYFGNKKRGFDVAVFVATSGERNSIIKYTQLVNDALWGLEHDKNGDVIRTMLVRNRDGRVLRLALKTLPEMGAEHCVYFVSQFLRDHPCKIAAMVGICAGEEKDTKKGDIVIPGRVASITNGKETEGDKKNRIFRPSNRIHEVHEGLRKELESFQQQYWEMVRKEIDNVWTPEKIEEVNDKFFCVPELHFEKKIMMAQVAHVRAYTGAYDDLKDYASREVVALEMESAALAFVTEVSNTDCRWIIAKGVQDYADGEKDHKPRAFCSWASFYILKRLLELQSFDCWEKKVRIKEDIEKNASLASTEDLKRAYRGGDFEQAARVGHELFDARPDDPSLWRNYLLALLRIRDYEKVSDVVSVIDYCIQNGNFTENQVIDYLIGKSDYYRRIESYKDANDIADDVIRRYQGNDKIKEQVAQAYYYKGRILLRHYQSGINSALGEAKGKFSAAVRLAPGKYWAAIALLFVHYLEDSSKKLNDAEIARLKTVIDEHINENERRPAPIIYKLKLQMLRFAAGELLFDDLKTEIDKDAGKNKHSLLLPDDFFTEFENDCRLLFSDAKYRHKQDLILSLVYYWAARVRLR